LRVHDLPGLLRLWQTVRSQRLHGPHVWQLCCLLRLLLPHLQQLVQRQ
jgi:hypothetical protein